MKLIHYTFRNLSIPLLIILTAWACCFYFVIMHEIDDETNDSLENYKGDHYQECPCRQHITA